MKNKELDVVFSFYYLKAQLELIQSDAETMNHICGTSANCE
jgi:hypothetical protein